MRVGPQLIRGVGLGLRVVLMTAVVAGQSASVARAQSYHRPTESKLISISDYCVILKINDAGRGIVERSIFGSLNPGVEVEPWVGRSNQADRRFICYFRQISSGLRAVPFGYREIDAEGIARAFPGVWCMDFMSDTCAADYHRADQPQDLAKLPTPTRLANYITLVVAAAEVERKTRLEAHKKGLDLLFDPETYLTETGAVRHDLMNEILWQVHAGDDLTLERMAQFVREKPEALFMHARGDLVRLIAKTRFKQGYDAIRLEATRNSAQGQNWGSERDAINALAAVGSAQDVELLKALVFKLVERHEGTLLRAVFPAIGRLADRVFDYESTERDGLRTWLERFCRQPTDKERAAGCHVYSAVALGKLGRPESLDLLEDLHATTPHAWYARAILEIKARTGK